VAGQWFSLGTLVSSCYGTAKHDITEILLKVVLNTITFTLTLLPWEMERAMNLSIILS
jgi:hypothetical protein